MPDEKKRTRSRSPSRPPSPTGEHRTLVETLDAEAITGVLGQLGHEVGTPLGSILLLAEMLESSLEELGAGDRHVQRAADVHRAALDIRSVVQGVIHLLRLRTGWISPHAGTLDVTHWVEDLGRRLDDTSPDLRVADDPRLPERLRTDSGFVREIVQHLLAWHRRRGGPGTLEVSATERGLLLTLRSAGPGPDWDVQALLDPLGAGDLGPARHHGGAGLELARVDALAWRLGGSVAGRTLPGGTEGEGTTVLEVEIPEDGEDPLAI